MYVCVGARGRECVKERKRRLCVGVHIREGDCESLFMRDGDHLCVHSVRRIALIMLSSSKLNVEWWTGFR